VQNYELMIYIFTGISGLMLAYLLFLSKLGPVWLSTLGLVGYASLLLSIPSALFGITTLGEGAGMLFYVPGGLFEFVLPILLLTRGFRRSDPISTPVATKRLATGVRS
jgi:hypothetical protein